MTVARRTLPLAVAGCLLAGWAPAQTAPVEARSELQALGARLDGAVRRVSRGSFLAASSATRSYLLPGLGVVFVLPPRALPSGPPRRLDSPALRALVDASRPIEQSLKSVRSPEERARLEQTLQSLREAQAQLRRSSGFALQLQSGPDGDVTVQTLTVGPDGDALAEAQRFFEGADQEVREMLTQAEQFRSQAEKARAEAEQQLRQRLQERAETPPPAAPPNPPTAPHPPPPPVPEVPPTPPWEIFFDLAEPQDARSPEAVIQEVRQAVVGTLAAHRGRLSGVRPDEMVMVAVDFLPSPRAGLRVAPERTLVIRVSKKDLDDLRARRLSSQDFEKRVLATEY